jgi:signal transduction histidine kinase
MSKSLRERWLCLSLSSRELILLLTASGSIIAVASSLDVFDRFLRWYIGRGGIGELEELAFAFVILPFAFGLFSWRRWKDLRVEMALRKKAEEELEQALQASKRLALENAAMAEIGRIISAAPNLKDVYGSFAEEVREFIPFDRVNINLLHEEEKTVSAVYSHGKAILGRQSGDVFPLAGTATEAVMSGRKGLRLHVKERAELQDRFPGLFPAFDAGHRSILVVPLISQDRFIGSLYLGATEPSAYTDRDLQVAENIGRQIAGTIANAQVYGELMRTRNALARQALELGRTNRELEQFVHIASHDLQEPLRMVAGYVQLLARRYRGRLDAEADEFIRFTVEGVDRMKKMFDDLITYSWVGTQERNGQAVSLEAVLDRVLQTLKNRIDEAKARVTRDPLPDVNAVPREMEQLFQSLIDNAVKFRGIAPPQVHVSARREGRNGWLFSVRDNGLGIAAEYASRVFVIFQRLNDRDRYPGNGIGLAICKKIVEHAGGALWFESEPGEGATFYFTLPGGTGEERSLS